MYGLTAVCPGYGIRDLSRGKDIILEHLYMNSYLGDLLVPAVYDVEKRSSNLLCSQQTPDKPSG